MLRNEDLAHPHDVAPVEEKERLERDTDSEDQDDWIRGDCFGHRGAPEK